MIDYKKCFLIAALLFGVFFSTKAQHYFFVEADGQQAFYIKKSDSLYSSSSNGFLIIPQNKEKTFVITIGFPQNKFPQVVFKLDDMDQDRGFQLKNFNEKGWGLFDRTSFKIIMQVTADDLMEKPQQDKNQKDAGELSNMLSMVTNDKTLPSKEKTGIKNAQKNPIQKPVVKPLKDTIKSSVKSSSLPTKPVNVITQLKIDSSDKGFLLIKYLDKTSDGKTDVVDLKIEVSNDDVIHKYRADSVSKKASQTSDSKSSTLIDTKNAVLDKTEKRVSLNCSLPVATDKEIKNIQRKLLGYVDGSEQLKFAEKIYKSKCFTTNQTMQISWFLLNEEIRLVFFEKVMTYISDQENIKLLESGFIKDVNIQAFKTLLSSKN
jgi:hypothetical protein